MIVLVERKNTSQYGIKSVRFAGTESWNTTPVEIIVPPFISTLGSDFYKIYFLVILLRQYKLHDFKDSFS